MKTTPGAPVPTLPAELADSVGFLLGKAMQRAGGAVEAALARYDLKARHYGALLALREHGPSSQQEVADLLVIDRTTMANIVDDLERLGLAERRPHPGNRRAHQVHLTERARREPPGMIAAVRQADREWTGRLSAAEVGQLRSLLRRAVGPPLGD